MSMLFNVLNAISNKNPLTFTAEEINSTIKLVKEGNPIINGLQYRKNKNERWINYTFDGDDGLEITLTNIGDYIQFQNINEKLSISNDDYIYFIITNRKLCCKW